AATPVGVDARGRDTVAGAVEALDGGAVPAGDLAVRVDDRATVGVDRGGGHDAGVVRALVAQRVHGGVRQVGRRVLGGLLGRGVPAVRDGDVLLQRAALEVGILTRSGVLVELLYLGDKVGGEVLVEREVAGHLAEALDAFLDRGGELFDGVALDDVRRGNRI